MSMLHLANYITKLSKKRYDSINLNIKQNEEEKKEKGISTCPICNCESFYKFHQPQDQNYSNDIFLCLRCGPYKRNADSGYFPMFTTNIPNYNLSSYLRHNFEDRTINTIDYTKDINNIVNIDSKDTLDFFIEKAKVNAPKFSEKQYYLLRALESLQEDLGEKICLNSINSECKKEVKDGSPIDKLVYENPYHESKLDEFSILNDYLISFSYLKKDEELEYCLKNLQDTKCINYKKENRIIEILPNGYEYLENHKIKDRTKSDKVFVAMDFGENNEDKKKNDDLWKAIEKTIVDLGYKAIRSDKEEYTGYIPDFILSSINESRFVIGDLSDGNNGVYFEVGYAYSRGIPIILITDDIKGTHFDLKQYNHIIYKDLKDFEDLKNALFWRIKNLFGSNK